MSLPRYVHRVGERYRVIVPTAMLATRYVGTRGSVTEAVLLRDDWLSEHGYPLPDADDEIEAPEQTSEAGNTSYREHGNYAEASAEGRRVVTLDDLIAVCGVDREVWRVLEWRAKAWEGYAKQERQDLRYEDGKIAEGYSQKQGIETVTLFSVWAKFVRREPVALRPTIQPAACAVQYEAPPGPAPGELGRALLIGDLQAGFRRDLRTARLIPFHDRRVMDLALQIAAVTGVNLVVLGGDVADMTEWTSKYAREPEFYWTTQPTLLELHWWLRQFRELLPQARIAFLEGNHEKRLRLALMDHLPAAYELRAVDEIDLPPALSMPKLLALDSLGVEWVGGYPKGQTWLNDGLVVDHGERASSTPGGTARATVEEQNVAAIFFHAHRREWVSRTVRVRGGQRTIEAFCPGCACHVDGRVPGQGKARWQQGLALVDYEAGGEDFAIAPIRVSGGRAIYDGKLYVSREREGELRASFPGWNW